MTHLTGTELVDLLDGHLRAERMRHAETCATCREHAHALRAVLRSAHADPIPEPSPLFWEHLSTRVSAAVQAGPLPSRWAALFASERWRLAAAAVVLLLVTAVGWQLFVSRSGGGAVSPATAPAGQTLTEASVEPDAEPFLDAWDAIEAVAEDLEWEEAQSIGIAFRPGSAEPHVDDLTVDERAELARLIEEELKRSGA